MADTLTLTLTLTRTHPLEAWRTAFAALSAALAPRLAIELEPLTTALDLRVDPSGLEAVGDALGGPLPTAPNTWTPVRGGRAVWLGPDEWLVTSSTATGPRWEDELRAVAGPHRGAAVDVSAQRAGIRLRGRDVRELLAFGCALDLRPSSFPPGSCAQTLLGQSGVLLVADLDPDDGGPLLDVVVRSSFAGYVAGWLLDAAEELRPLPQGPLPQGPLPETTDHADQEGDGT